MKRLAYNELLQWKQDPARKPLIIKGARQVGKTWLMKTFGENEYRQVLYVNFEQSKHLRTIFKQDFDIERILFALSVETKIQPDNNTLIILDEIQEADEGVTALKYFYEDAPELHVMAAGSYLGISLHKNYSFPVGKVNLMDLYPMNFIEFLFALNEEQLAEILLKQKWDFTRVFHGKFLDILKKYFIVGGMPEVVKNFIENRNFELVRKTQNEILKAFENDFSKHVPTKELAKVKMIWEHIPAQLAKENKKFFFSHLKKGARAKEFETALKWLEETGLISKVYRITKPALPLNAYHDIKSFKVFFLDTGLLAAMSLLDYQVILEETKVFTEFKGAMSEQFVFQQIKSINPFYWSSVNGKSEVDFVVQFKQKIFPVEVKAGNNPKSKSLKFFYDRYEIPIAIRLSLLPYKEQEWLVNYPLYSAGKQIFESFVYGEK